MSELIAEARVLVTPDTTAFRTQLIAQTTAAAKGVVVPVQVTPVVTQTAGASSLIAQEGAIARASRESADAIRGGTIARQEAARSTQAYARQLSGLSSGAASAGLSLVGLRGATLAASGPFLVGAAAAISFGKAIQLATSFNQEISVLGAVTGATGEELDRAAAAAREFGRDITLPGVTAGDAAKTITEFSKAGLTLNESIAATRGGLQLAQAAQIDYSSAVQLSANALNAFNLSGNQAVHVADVLANSANLAQGGIEDTALALRQAAAAAEVVGVSFEDTSALLTLLARNGLTGSDAGTALRTSFLRLVNPSKEAKQVLQDLNVQLRDAQGNLRPEVFAEFAAAQRNLAVSTQQANAAIVFGQDAFRAFGILGAEGTQGLEDIRRGLEQQGTAAKVAAARMSGLAGASENLQNQLSDLGLAIGEIATPPLTFFVNEVARYVAVVPEAIRASQNLATAIKDLIPEGPAGFDRPGRDDDPLGVIKTIFGKTNPITGVASPIGQLKLFNKLFGDEGENTQDTAKKVGVDIRDGIESAGRDAARGAQTFQSSVVGAFQSGFDQINAAIREGAAKTRASIQQSILGGQGQQAGLEEAFNQIVAGGGSEQQQLANLRRQAETQAKIIAKAGPDAAGVILEERRAAQAKLAGIEKQITAIEESQAADAQAARDERQRIRDDSKRAADQSFLEEQQDARSRQERLVSLAGETEQLTDDIRRRQALRVLITQQIVALRASALDEKAKQDAIKILVAAKQATSDQINELVKADKKQQAAAKAEAQAAREQAREELEAAKIALGESILERTGNKNPLIRALDASIKDAIRERNLAKKGSLAFIQAQTEINNMLARRKELLKKAEEDADAVGGTSLDELFRRAAEITGGASNTGFSAAGLQGLSARPRIQTEVQERLDIVNDPLVAAAKAQNDAIGRLIVSLDRLNESLTGGNATTAGPLAGGTTNRPWKALTQEQRFFLQKQAENMVQNGLVGGSR